MKVLLLTSLTFALLHCANSFIRRNVLLRYSHSSLFCNNPLDNDGKEGEKEGEKKKEGEPKKISIKSVTDMFNKYLALEQEQNNISEEFAVISRTQIKPPPKKTEIETSSSDDYNQLSVIHLNMHKQKLLKVLENTKVSEITKMEYIENAKWLFDQQYSVNMSNGGLMDDWNFTIIE